MTELYDGGAYLIHGDRLVKEADVAELVPLTGAPVSKDGAKKGTTAYSTLEAHNTSGSMNRLKLRFDAMASHDITFVGIVQTTKASGMTRFPLPYVLTNCHNFPCAIGGTTNEDDHILGLTAVKRYGGIFVPPHIAVIHQYMREMMAGCGKMILGFDSHTRYGALDTMAVGEGGGELAKQLLCDTYDVVCSEVVAAYLGGKPGPGVGPHDMALVIVGAVFKNDYVENKVVESAGPGVSSMDTDYRNGADVMTMETTCLSPIWRTNEDTKAFPTMHGRGDEYQELNPVDVTYYSGVVKADLSTIKPTIAPPFYPDNTYETDKLTANPGDILRSVEKEAAKISGRSEGEFRLTDKIVNGELTVQQGIIAGCVGGNYTSVMAAAHVLKGRDYGSDIFTPVVYLSPQPAFMGLVKKGVISDLMAVGAIVKTAFCGPCFGAGDTSANNTLDIHHITRNSPNREGSKLGNGQVAAVALMDIRFITATAASGGVSTSAATVADGYQIPEYELDDSAYRGRVYQGYQKAGENEEVVYGPNIKDWLEMSPLADNILLKVCSKITDDVTTTDELIPSGETSFCRPNSLGLAEFTLSRRDPAYMGKSKEVDVIKKVRTRGENPEKAAPELATIFDTIRTIPGNEAVKAEDTEIGSTTHARKPGDGSARKQVTSCQRVLGGLANIAREHATKRYRSNVMNWGMLSFLMDEEPEFEVGDYIYVPGILKTLDGIMEDIPAYVVKADGASKTTLHVADMTEDEKKTVKAGCLINYNRNRNNA